jgi:hypothetical protein
MAKKSKRTNKRRYTKIYRNKKRRYTKRKSKKRMKGGSKPKMTEEEQLKFDTEMALAMSLSEGVPPTEEELKALQIEDDAKQAQMLVDTELAKRLSQGPRGGVKGPGRAAKGPGGGAKGPGGGAKASPCRLSKDSRNMLEVSYIEYSKGRNVGYLIAGNAGIVGGGLMDKSRAPGADPRWNIDCSDKKKDMPQEEGSFINFCCATRDYKKKVYQRKPDQYFFGLMKAADKVWGMENLTGTDHHTKQGVDYTKGVNFELKYRKCIYVGKMSGYSQKGLGTTLDEWDESKSFPCKVFITAGPQAKKPDRTWSSTSTMRRTYDHIANEGFSYLIAAIKEAYIGSLIEMDKQGVTVAIVPGLSTGVYAPDDKQKLILSKIPQIITEAIITVSPTNIQKVIYCNPDN